FMVANVDVVTTITLELANQLRKLNSNVAVIPNSVDLEAWSIKPRMAGERLRVGWLGGSSHFLDLAIAVDVLSELIRKSFFTFVVYGLTNMLSVQEFYDKHIKLEGERFRNHALGRAIK